MNNKTVTILIVSAVVLCGCCLALLAGSFALFWNYGSEIMHPIPNQNLPTPQVTTIKLGCQVSGCSGTLCVAPDENDITTTCEWVESYRCFEDARCERQPEGHCGWTFTHEYFSCLADVELGK